MSPEFPIGLPQAVENRLTHIGAAGAAWKAQLPERLKSLQKRWDLDFGTVLHGGSEALVVAATRHGREQTIVKLLLPTVIEPGQTEELTSNELLVLRAASGRGYVEVLAFDEACGAMLLPRLGAPLGQNVADAKDQQRILCDTLKVAWQTDAHDLGLQTGAEKATWLRRFIASLAADFDLSADALATAIEFTHAREHAHMAATKVLVHGDAHEFNALLANDGSYRLIDPDGLYAEPEYDLGIIMREASAELIQPTGGDVAPIDLGIARCKRLARLTGTDAQAIWQWGYIERVSSALYTLKLDLPEYGEPALAVANSWAQQDARHCFEANSFEHPYAV